MYPFLVTRLLWLGEKETDRLTFLISRYVESQVNKTVTVNGVEVVIPADPDEKWKGFFYAFLLLVTTVFQVS